MFFRNLFRRLFGPAPDPVSINPGEFLASINAARGEVGLPALSASSILNNRAQQHADSMLASGILSHDGFTQRAAGYSAAAENVAEGYATAPGCVRGWVASPPHNANLIGPYTLCGVGHAGSYWCAIFARV